MYSRTHALLRAPRSSQRQGAAIEELCSILRNFKEHQIQIEAAMTAPR